MRQFILLSSFCLTGFSGLSLHAGEPPITAIEFSPDGQQVVVASQAGLRVLSWPSLAEVQRIQLSMLNAHDLSFSPDGKILSVAGGVPAEKGVVELLDWPAGESVQVFQDHEDSVMSLVWLSTIKFASASLDHSIVIRGITAGVSEATLRGHSRGVTAITYLPQDNVLVSGSLDQNIRVWNIDNLEVIRTLNNHTGPIQQVALRPSASVGLPLVATASQDRTVRLWQPTIGRLMRFVRLSATPLGLAWTKDGSLILVSTTDGQLVVVDPDTAQIVATRPALDDWAYAVAVHPTDDMLLLGGRQGQLKRLQFSTADAYTRP
jgi:WD40 repeat protein